MFVSWFWPLHHCINLPQYFSAVLSESATESGEIVTSLRCHAILIHIRRPFITPFCKPKERSFWYINDMKGRLQYLWEAFSRDGPFSACTSISQLTSAKDYEQDGKIVHLDANVISNDDRSQPPRCLLEWKNICHPLLVWSRPTCFRDGKPHYNHFDCP